MKCGKLFDINYWEGRWKSTPYEVRLGTFVWFVLDFAWSLISWQISDLQQKSKKIPLKTKGAQPETAHRQFVDEGNPSSSDQGGSPQRKSTDATLLLEGSPVFVDIDGFDETSMDHV
jgi:hypothetical protein